MNLIVKLLLIILSGHFFCSALIDFVAVPKVFQTVSSQIEAGTLGMHIFKIFNRVEVLWSVLAVALSLRLLFKTKLLRDKILVGGAMILTVLSLSYSLYITPKITELNKKKYKLELESNEYLEVERVHNFYHKLYVKLDAGKLTILLIMLGILLKQREEEA